MSARRRRLDQVGVGLPRQPAQPLAPRRRGLPERLAHPRAARVQRPLPVRLRILPLQQTHVRQLLLRGVDDAHGDEVVPATRALQLPLEVLVEEIAEQEDDGPAVQHACQEVEGVAQRRAAALGAEQEGVADQPQHVPGALARRDVVLDAVAELEQGGPVVVGQGAERQHRRQLRHHLTLRLQAGAEPLAVADVHGQNDGQFALLDEALDEGMAGAGGDVPVDGPHVVAGLVLADLVEGQAGPLEGAVVGAAEQALDDAAGPQLQAADLTQHLARQHDHPHGDPSSLTHPGILG